MRGSTINAIREIAKNFINLIYPLHCQICKAALQPLNQYYLCHRCIAGFKKNPEPSYKRFGRLIVYSACLYEGPLKECIHMFKYNRKVFLSKILSKLIIDFVKENIEVLDGVELLTPVPLHPGRLRIREFNQSDILAHHLEKEFGIPVSHTLIKVERTTPQSDLKRRERLINLRGAFRIKEDADVRDKEVLIVDDVLTTGATVYQCSKVLYQAGARRVSALTLARGV